MWSIYLIILNHNKITKQTIKYHRYIYQININARQN